MSFKKYVEKNNLGIIDNNKSFKDLTTMKVGGKIKILYYPNSTRNLTDALIYIKKHHKKSFFIGNGSNIVANDKPYKGIVISGKHLVSDPIFHKDCFIVSAFMDMRSLVGLLVNKGIATLTNLSGIPGTVGGAIYMNAGAFGSQISANLLWVKYLEDGLIKTASITELIFDYRKTSFQTKSCIIIEACFKTIVDKKTIYKYHDIISKRKARHPLNYPNSGSIFRNSEDYFAYEIIRKIGLVDSKVGDVCFSKKHSNFIINLGNAKGKDIYKLIRIAKKKAKTEENINLEEEVVLFNF